MKEQFSLSFVHMIASAAGCSIKSHATDYDGVDITISSSAEYATYYCPEFELQLKATAQRDLLKDDHLSWTMKAIPFKKLTNPKRFAPAYLGVLLLPEGGWLEQDEERLVTGSRMYWQSAADLGSIGDDEASKTVRLPRSNLFDIPQLQGIMKTIGDRGDW
ncbi:DUF4365 domain-containing protein [Acrocarpospora macrocephala]|nr:DUF4365 domain-containing protein [Acrocarpospora macrocephala]